MAVEPSPDPASTETRRPPSADPRWREQHQLVADLDDGRRVAMLLGLHLPVGRASFRCGLLAAVGDSRPPVVIAESDIEPPAELWEFRASGLWVEQVCEQPLIHWSYGLEAFALTIDRPDELLGRGYGDRVPLGWELDFTASATDAGLDDGPEYRLVTQPGRLDGLLLTKAGDEPIAGTAVRHHWWGTVDPPGLGVGTSGPGGPVGSDGAELDPGREDREGPIALPGLDGVWWVPRPG